MQQNGAVSRIVFTVDTEMSIQIRGVKESKNVFVAGDFLAHKDGFALWKHERETRDAVRSKRAGQGQF